MIGFDDSKFCEFLDPPLTSIHQPSQIIGNNACEVLISRITSENTDNIRDVFFSPTLKERESVNKENSALI